MTTNRSDELDDFADQFKAWEERELASFLEKAPERRKEFRTLTGFPVKRVYTPLDVADTPPEDIGLPGQYPYTRGPYPTMPVAWNGCAILARRKHNPFNSPCRRPTLSRIKSRSRQFPTCPNPRSPALNCPPCASSVRLARRTSWPKAPKGCI